MPKEITFALTSCGRPDLLMETLDSFVEQNDYPIARYKIIDDSAIPGINDAVMEKYLNIEWIHNTERLGQSKSIDILYDDIDTEYIFHCEDDWKFLAPGFIEKSIELLESDRLLLQAWLRGYDDVNEHPLHEEKNGMRVVSYGYQGVWHGFSFNPGLRRLSDYMKVKPYSSLGWEKEINQFYMTMGMYAVVLPQRFVEHTGWGRHMQDAKG